MKLNMICVNNRQTKIWTFEVVKIFL